MKKQLLAGSLLLIGIGVLAFLQVRSGRIIRQQEQSLAALSARASGLERHALAPNSAPTVESLKAEVDRLHQTVADLQARLDRVQMQGRVIWDGSLGRNAVGETNGTINVLPENVITPQPQSPENMPPGSVPFEFNGTTYYRVPLAFAK